MLAGSIAAPAAWTPGSSPGVTSGERAKPPPIIAARSSGRRELARQRLGDQRPRLLDAVERDERAEARPALLAEQHGVEHGKKLARHAGPLRRRPLGVEVLVTCDRPR